MNKKPGNPLTAVRIVDRNGKTTTVHKRTGTAAPSSRKLAGAQPKLAKAAPLSKADKPVDFPIREGFLRSVGGARLNERFPERRLQPGDVLRFSSRDVFEVASYGVAVTDAAALLHFGIRERAEVEGAVRVLGGENFRLVDRPWMRALADRGIDRDTLMKASNNGLRSEWLDEQDVEIALDLVQAAAYKVVAKKTALMKDIEEGAIRWSDIMEIGPVRAAEYADSLFYALTGEPPVPTSVIREAIIERQERPRSSFLRFYSGKGSGQVDTVIRGYRLVGERIAEFHLPELPEEIQRIDPDREISGTAQYCDEVIHRVRSSDRLTDEVIAASGEYPYPERKGTYPGQYEPHEDPKWDLPKLIEFHDRGLSVEECVESLRRGIGPLKAVAVHRGIAGAVADGWI